jgi:general secretion pathway protein F
MTLDAALGAAAAQADDPRAAKLLAAIRGTSAAASRSRRARALPAHVLAAVPGLVAAASETGRLPDVLGRLADYLEARLALQERFTTALIYPALVAVIAFAGDRRAAGLRRAAGRLGLPAEPQALPWLTRR